MFGLPSTKQMITIAVIAVVAVGIAAYFSMRYRASLSGINPLKVDTKTGAVSA